MADKLAAAEEKYGYTNGWERADWMDECREHLRRHVEKGDPRDVAAYCAFLWHHNEKTSAPPPPDRVQPERVEAVECDYCGGSGFINVLDDDGVPVLDLCDAPAHDAPNDASGGVTDAMVEAALPVLAISVACGVDRSPLVRAVLEAADRARKVSPVATQPDTRRVASGEDNNGNR